jgi:hypothetical protein
LAALPELDDAELRGQGRHDDRRCGLVLLVRLEERPQVDVVQLVAVEREQRAGLLAVLRREPQASPAPERLRLRHPDDLGAETRQLRLEEAGLSGPTADDHAVDARAHELRHLVLGQRMPRDRDERLRPAARRVAHARRLAARKDDCLH